MASCPHCGTARQLPGQQCPALRVALLRRACTSYPPQLHRDGPTGPCLHLAAGFWRRFLGFFIDDILLLIIGWADARRPPRRLTSHRRHWGDGDHLSLQLTAHRTPSRRPYRHASRFGPVRDQDGATPLTYARAAKRAIFSTALLALGTFHHCTATSTPRLPNCIASFHAELIFPRFSCRTHRPSVGRVGQEKSRHCTNKFGQTVVIKTSSSGSALGETNLSVRWRFLGGQS